MLQFLPALVAHIKRTAPAARLELMPLSQAYDYRRHLASGEVVCLVSEQHPLARSAAGRGWTTEKYLACEHVAPMPLHPGDLGVIDQHLAAQGAQRQIVVRASHFGLIPTMVADSLLVLTTGRLFCSRYVDALPVKIIRCPVVFPPLSYYQAYPPPKAQPKPRFFAEKFHFVLANLSENFTRFACLRKISIRSTACEFLTCHGLSLTSLFPAVTGMVPVAGHYKKGNCMRVKPNSLLAVLVGLTVNLGLTATAHAALQGRDLNGSADSFEAYYDTDLNITWLANANVNGQMIWRDANTWAANLSIVDTVNNLTYDNWRLPTTLQPDVSCSIVGIYSYGHNCTGSEMGHLFYADLGGTGDESILDSGDPDLAKFTNLQANYYWTGSMCERLEGTICGPDFLAWSFNFSNGIQLPVGMVFGRYVLAVTPGDVSPVPEPETWAMLLAGLGLVGVATRRRRGG